jgi:hypothetical protein
MRWYNDEFVKGYNKRKVSIPDYDMLTRCKLLPYDSHLFS